MVWNIFNCTSSATWDGSARPLPLVVTETEEAMQILSGQNARQLRIDQARWAPH
jgi:hypothetical protein